MKILNLYVIHKGLRIELTQTLLNLPSPLSFDKLRMVSLVEPFVKEG
jgi:hypothetical protein